MTEQLQKESENRGSSVERIVMRPGAGWKHLNGAVWEHKNGVRIHTSGRLLRDPDGNIVPVGEFAKRKLLYQLIKINGGNRKRAMMAFALNFFDV